MVKAIKAQRYKGSCSEKTNASVVKALNRDLRSLGSVPSTQGLLFHFGQVTLSIYTQTFL